METSQVRLKTNQLLADYQQASRTALEETKALGEARRKLAYLEAARDTINEVAKQVQEQAHGQVATVVSRCLNAVFGADAYEFRLIFDKKRNKTEARMVFVRGGMEIDPASAAGGGALDVAAFALRLACLILYRPKLRRFLFLDEPFKMLSAEYRPAVRQLLEDLSRELPLQLLIITHSEEFMVGKVLKMTEM